MQWQYAGATVMPHNIILHSSLIQTRNYPRTTAGKRMAVRVRPACVGLSCIVGLRGIPRVL